MFEFLLEERHRAALKKYFSVLQALPDTLALLKRYSDTLQSQGHLLTTPPDAERLKVLASFSAGYLAQLESQVSAAAKVGNACLNDVVTFTAQCRLLGMETPRHGRNVYIRSLDFKRFSLAGGPWISSAPKDVYGLIHDLHLRLRRGRFALLDLKGLSDELRLDTQSIFQRFVHSLMINPCQCHSAYSRLQGWYVQGLSTLPGMSASGSADNAESARQSLANEHLQALSVIRAGAYSTINNLSDFLYAMCRFLEDAADELLRLGPDITLAQLNSELTTTEHRLEEVGPMLEHLQQWSRA